MSSFRNDSLNYRMETEPKFEQICEAYDGYSGSRRQMKTLKNNSNANRFELITHMSKRHLREAKGKNKCIVSEEEDEVFGDYYDEKYECSQHASMLYSQAVERYKSRNVEVNLEEKGAFFGRNFRSLSLANDWAKLCTEFRQYERGTTCLAFLANDQLYAASDTRVTNYSKLTSLSVCDEGRLKTIRVINNLSVSIAGAYGNAKQVLRNLKEKLTNKELHLNEVVDIVVHTMKYWSNFDRSKNERVSFIFYGLDKDGKPSACKVQSEETSVPSYLSATTPLAIGCGKNEAIKFLTGLIDDKRTIFSDLDEEKSKKLARDAIRFANTSYRGSGLYVHVFSWKEKHLNLIEYYDNILEDEENDFNPRYFLDLYAAQPKK